MPAVNVTSDLIGEELKTCENVARVIDQLTCENVARVIDSLILNLTQPPVYEGDGLSSQNYVPTVFENYTASFEIDTQRIELSLWDTSGSPYYDNVRPLSYPDSDAVLICFDISRPETLDSVLKKWKGEIQEFCPNTKMLLVGCKSDLRTALSTLVELSNHRQTPVSYDQGSNMAKQIGAPYIECSSLQSENSVRDIFHVATLACVNKTNKNVKRNKSTRATKRISHMPSRPDLSAVTSELRKDKAKSCTVM
ncbi:Rho-related GTP-binding protein RhoE [Acipenser ruthenus]|uniref:Rho-related GTP-binding protein RhoE n=1 Tax=Acipenser ruthenus TaxID=7906 RepID=A0A444UFL8_ACIRT|nr:Rho-related GTP-binding protein RhoE [Acipenser ruthenus]